MINYKIIRDSTSKGLEEKINLILKDSSYSLHGITFMSNSDDDGRMFNQAVIQEDEVGKYASYD